MKYQVFLDRISTNKDRLMASLLASFCCIVVFVKFWRFDRPLNFGLIIFGTFYAFLILFLVFYVFFTIVHVIRTKIETKIISEWNFRKDIRLWCFGSLVWAIGVFLFVLLFDPYDGCMYSDDQFKVILFMLIPPLFVGSAKYIYDKYVKYGVTEGVGTVVQDGVAEDVDTVVQECKIIIDCPVCKKKMRIPNNLSINVTCPFCDYVFQVKNGKITG